MSDNFSDPDRIERELDSTRSRLGSHLSELQDRLSPGQVLDDLMGYFRGSEGGEFARNLVDSVRANPLPAAITGIGLAWLMTANPRPAPGRAEAQPVVRDRVQFSPLAGDAGPIESMTDGVPARVRSAELGVARQPGETDYAFRDRVNDAKGQALGLARQAQETAESFGQRIQDALSAAVQAVGQGASTATQAVAATMHDLRNGVSGAASGLGSAVHSARAGVAQGSQSAQRLGGGLVSTLSDSPVLLGALGLAAGALLGALIPTSDQEEAALGGIAGQARDTARNLAQEAIDRGGNVAQSILKAGQDSAREHGLTGGGASVGGLVDAALSGDLAANAKQVAQDVLRAGDEAARKEGLKRGQDGPKSTEGA